MIIDRRRDTDGDFKSGGQSGAASKKEGDYPGVAGEFCGGDQGLGIEMGNSPEYAGYPDSSAAGSIF